MNRMVYSENKIFCPEWMKMSSPGTEGVKEEVIGAGS